MAEAFNWHEIEQASGGNYKNFAPNGEYIVKLAKVKVTDGQAKSPAINFEWEDNEEFKFPRSVSHWLAMGNANWRRFHMRNIFMVLGMNKEQAQKLVESAEVSTERPKLVANYQKIFDRLTQKHPEVKIVVRNQIRDGKPVRSEKGTIYGESEFADPRVALPVSTPASTSVVEDVMGAVEDVATDLGEIPFI